MQIWKLDCFFIGPLKTCVATIATIDLRVLMRPRLRQFGGLNLPQLPLNLNTQVSTEMTSDGKQVNSTS